MADGLLWLLRYYINNDCFPIGGKPLIHGKKTGIQQ